jgi:hypothetical protein
MLMKRGFLACGMAAACVLAAASSAVGQAKHTAEAWPDPLVTADGKPVMSAAEFTRVRKAELLRAFAEDVYGRTPDGKLPAAVHVTSEAVALDGAAVRKQVTLTVGVAPKTRDLHLLLYLPAKAKGPVPVFVGLNFDGNASTTADPGVDLGKVWVPDPAETGIPLGSLKNNIHEAPAESLRGHDASKWPFAAIVKAGYGVATLYAGDLEPDYATGIGFGARPLFFKPGQYMPDLHDWGAIGAWAWGLSRVADYLETDKAVDGKALILTGHSRMGKAALWAAAQDDRFAMVISNESGQGGAGLSHREAGETIWHLNVAFPYWFSPAFHAYNGRPQAYPLDGHLLLSLIAPRPLFVASAEDDSLSDPKGEFASAKAASAVYRLYGKEGLPEDASFVVGKLMGKDVRYYCRPGKHDMLLEDWQRYIAFANGYFKTGRP